MKRRYYAAILAHCAFIFWLSSRPIPDVFEVRFPGEDKVAHMIIFGLLAGLVSVGLHRSGRPHAPWVLRYGPVMFATLYGAIDEIHQLFVPMRTFSLLDLVADLAGALLVHGFCTLYFRRYPAAARLRTDET